MMMEKRSIEDLQIIRYTNLEKLKHLIEDVLEYNESLCTTDDTDGVELCLALKRLRKFYNETEIKAES